MAVDDGGDIYDLPDLDEVSYSFSDETESGLCVPMDPIESLSWLPTFSNKPISFHDLDLPKHDDDDDNHEVGFASWPCVKRQRSERSSKKKRRRVLPSSSEEEEESCAVGDGGRVKRCSHCQTSKTPQWRIGPLGPKTLCNACGVRYRSGRLVPEYRPTASPTFDSGKHSNFHTKIEKIRKGITSSVI